MSSPETHHFCHWSRNILIIQSHSDCKEIWFSIINSDALAHKTIKVQFCSFALMQLQSTAVQSNLWTIMLLQSSRNDETQFLRQNHIDHQDFLMWIKYFSLCFSTRIIRISMLQHIWYYYAKRASTYTAHDWQRSRFLYNSFEASEIIDLILLAVSYSLDI